MQNTELEIKYLLSTKKAEELRTKIQQLSEMTELGEAYEKTTMLDNTSGILGAEDARLRVREIKKTGTDSTQIEFSYKKRLQAEGGIKREEEIELAFQENPTHLYAILQKMGFSPITSYERYRETFLVGTDRTKITLDRFPFGYILEIEGTEENIQNYCKELGLSMEESYALSCDDAYVELCQRDGISPNDHIAFDDPQMPQIG